MKYPAPNKRIHTCSKHGQEEPIIPARNTSFSNSTQENLNPISTKPQT